MNEQTDATVVRDRKEDMSMVLSTLEQEHTFKTPDDIEMLYLYRDGVYVHADTIVKARIEELLGDDTNTHFCQETLEHLKRRSYIPRESMNSYQGLIPVENGLLNLETLELVPHDPERLFTFKLPTKYDATADCPEFKKWLSQVLPVPDVQNLIQEYAGYTLWPAMPYHKFMVFLGSGRNGKGTFDRTMECILGKDNISYVQLEELDGSHRFVVANLYGSLMNISSEPSTSRPFRTETLKRCTGENTVQAEIKNRQNRPKFMPFAKFIIEANHLPPVNDSTVSFWERALVTEWNETFTAEKGNLIVNIENTWLCSETERSGILNWMIEGLRRLRQNGQFTCTKDQNETMLTWKQVSDPIGAFLSDPEQVIYSPELQVTHAELYGSYSDYSASLGVPAESNRKLAERVRGQHGVRDDQARPGGKKARVWKGIGLVTKNSDNDCTTSTEPAQTGLVEEDPPDIRSEVRDLFNPDLDRQIVQAQHIEDIRERLLPTRPQLTKERLRQVLDRLCAEEFLIETSTDVFERRG